MKRPKRAQKKKPPLMARNSRAAVAAGWNAASRKKNSRRKLLKRNSRWRFSLNLIPSRRATVKCLFSPAGPFRAVCTRGHVRQCLAAEPLPKGTEKSHNPRMARLLVPVRARVLRAHRIRSAGRLSGLLLLGRTFPRTGNLAPHREPLSLSAARLARKCAPPPNGRFRRAVL